MTKADLASYNASSTFFEDAIMILGDVDTMTPDAFCDRCDRLLDRDERNRCRACNAISNDRDQLDGNYIRP